MSCKYCEFSETGYGVKIGDELPYDMHEHMEMRLCVIMDEDAKQLTHHIVARPITQELGIRSYPINYCPICGEKFN